MPIEISSGRCVLARLAVMCTACDIPAVRKICGFAGHSAIMGCSKCTSKFVHQEWGMDYSGFEREEWMTRTLEAHTQHAIEYLAAKTASQQDEVLRRYGVRYSLLLELPYFNIVRCHVIDPMHNLLLGTAKHIMNIWTSNGILTHRDLEINEKRVTEIQSPIDVGWLSLKIGSGFAGFTADQWLNWIVIYSPIALKGVLPPVHITCWLLYVRACSILCSKVIKKSDVQTGDQYLLHFCRSFKALYGAEACTPMLCSPH